MNVITSTVTTSLLLLRWSFYQYVTSRPVYLMIRLIAIGGDATYFARYLASPRHCSGTLPLVTCATSPFGYFLYKSSISLFISSLGITCLTILNR